MLDHILLGCGGLQGGVDFVEKGTGVRAAFGGVHPGRGTQNALISLGERRYLEVIAPDPKQDVPDELGLRLLERPKLVGWAAHPGGLAGIAQRLKMAGIGFEGPRPGSRTRPDGRVLSWKTLTLADDQQHLLPFLIEWGANVVHPSADAPAGCRLERFVAETPDPDALTKAAAQLAVEFTIEKSNSSRLRAIIAGPHGQLELSS
jgi:Glyoxalase-like domain